MQSSEFPLEVVVQSGRETLRAFVLVSGGAAVALIALVGAIGASEPTLATGLAGACAWYLAAVTAGVFSTGLTFLSHTAFYLARWRDDKVLYFTGTGLMVAAIAVGLGNILCFLAGSMVGIRALRALG